MVRLTVALSRTNYTSSDWASGAASGAATANFADAGNRTVIYVRSGSDGYATFLRLCYGWLGPVTAINACMIVIR